MNTPSPSSECPLEAQLKKHFTPIPDNGFSATVLANLPPPASKPRLLPDRRLIAILSGLFAAIFCAVFIPVESGSGDIETYWKPLLNNLAALTTDHDKLMPLINSAAVIGLSLFVAFFRKISSKVRIFGFY